MAITKITRDALNTGIDDNSNATAITIDSSEQVGIGTATPTGVKLHVAGGVKATDLVSHDSTGINLQTDEGTKRLILDDSGRITMPSQPTYHGHFNAVFGANSSFNTRITAHIATVQNVGNMFNSSNTRWTVPVAGQYLFHVTAMKSGNSVAAGHLDLSFNGQGANTTYRVRMSEGATYDQPAFTVVRNMAANDYMELYYYGTPAIHSEHSSIVVRLLG